MDTNDSRPVAIKTPLLVDTNNVAPKLASLVLNLPGMRDSGQFGPVRLGMTMEEVVACWGKPRWFWSRCFGGPRLFYTDINVVFEPHTNSVRSILLAANQIPRFEHGLSAASTPEDFMRVLGSPTARHDRAGALTQLTYDAPSARLRLDFSESALSALRLEVCPPKTE